MTARLGTYPDPRKTRDKKLFDVTTLMSAEQIKRPTFNGRFMVDHAERPLKVGPSTASG